MFASAIAMYLCYLHWFVSGVERNFWLHAMCACTE